MTRRQPLDLTAEQREGLREVAADRAHNVDDNTLSDLMLKGLVKRTPDANRVLTRRGREVHDHIMRSGDGPEALKDLFRM